MICNRHALARKTALAAIQIVLRVGTVHLTYINIQKSSAQHSCCNIWAIKHRHKESDRVVGRTFMYLGGGVDNKMYAHLNCTHRKTQTNYIFSYFLSQSIILQHRGGSKSLIFSILESSQAILSLQLTRFIYIPMPLLCADLFILAACNCMLDQLVNKKQPFLSVTALFPLLSISNIKQQPKIISYIKVLTSEKTFWMQSKKEKKRFPKAFWERKGSTCPKNSHLLSEPLHINITHSSCRRGLLGDFEDSPNSSQDADI